MPALNYLGRAEPRAPPPLLLPVPPPLFHACPRKEEILMHHAPPACTACHAAMPILEHPNPVRHSFSSYPLRRPSYPPRLAPLPLLANQPQQ